MSDQTVREGDRQLDREAKYSDRLQERINKILPSVASDPNTYGIDVDLLDAGHFLEFLEEAIATPGGDVLRALQKLAKEYRKLAEAAAEKEAEAELREEDEARGYDG